jgi:hypothetical protein
MKETMLWISLDSHYYFFREQHIDVASAFHLLLR